MDQAGDKLIEVLQNVLIVGVEVEGDEIRVDVYGGDERICGTVVYTFPDRKIRQLQVETLRYWCDTTTPLTYVQRGSTVALLDETALLSSALAD